MRISDWSSDVCSSDLHHRQCHHRAEQACGLRIDEQRVGGLREEQETEFAALAEQQAEAERGLPALAECLDDQRQHGDLHRHQRSEEHTSELQSLMRISYAVFCLTKKKHSTT